MAAAVENAFAQTAHSPVEALQPSTRTERNLANAVSSDDDRVIDPLSVYPSHFSSRVRSARFTRE